MTVTPQECVRIIKVRLKGLSPERLTMSKLAQIAYNMHLVEARGFIAYRYGTALLVYFASWDNISQKVEALLKKEDGIVCERIRYNTLCVYYGDAPPGPKARKAIGKLCSHR